MQSLRYVAVVKDTAREAIYGNLAINDDATLKAMMSFCQQGAQELQRENQSAAGVSHDSGHIARVADVWKHRLLV